MPWGAAATAEAVLAMRAGLPARGPWSAIGISRHQFPTVALAAVLGRHVQVEQAAALVRGIGAEVATPAEARRCWGWGRARAGRPLTAGRRQS